MLVLLVLCSLISISTSAVCIGTTAISSTTSCPLTSKALCNHKYQMFGGMAYDCYVSYLNLCARKMGSCTPICNGTISTTNCASAPQTLCDRYYQTDGTGSYYCKHNPSTNACVVSSPKLYCATGYSVACSGTAISSDGCSSVTTQAACNSRFAVQTQGQNNMCAWDSTRNICYVGVPCY